MEIIHYTKRIQNIIYNKNGKSNFSIQKEVNKWKMLNMCFYMITKFKHQSKAEHTHTPDNYSIWLTAVGFQLVARQKLTLAHLLNSHVAYALIFRLKNKDSIYILSFRSKFTNNVNITKCATKPPFPRETSPVRM